MARILFFTDSHLQAGTPARRLGSYEDDVVGKIAWLLVEAQRREVDAVVCGGDLFDQPRPSYRLAVDVLRMIRNAGIPWLHVLGNHELIGHNPDTYRNGVLAFYEQADEFEILRDREIGGYVLRAIHYRHGVEELIDWEPLGDLPEIIVAHAMIVPTERPYPHVLPKAIRTSAHLVLAGHAHDPWAAGVSRGTGDQDLRRRLADGLSMLLNDPKETRLVLSENWDCTVFINPGSLGRIAYLSHNLGRTPRVLVIETGPPLSITAVPVAVARPSKEVFDTAAVDAAKSWEVRVQAFIDAMRDVRVEGIEASAIVIGAAKARAEVDSIEEIPDDQRAVLDHALEAIALVEAEEKGEGS